MTTQQILFVAGGSLFTIGLVALAPVLRIAWMFLDKQEMIKQMTAQLEEAKAASSQMQQLCRDDVAAADRVLEELILIFKKNALSWSSEEARQKLTKLRVDQQKGDLEPESYEPFIEALLQVHPDLKEVS